MKRAPEHKKLKKQISPEEIKLTVSYASPSIAADQIIKMNSPARACALIDSVDPLTAAFILNELHYMSMSDSQRIAAGDLLAIEEPRVKLVNTILARASRLKIRGTKGLCHARDEIYKQTGVFLV